MTVLLRTPAQVCGGASAPHAAFYLGLPALRGALLTEAKALRAPVLISANSFSVWRIIPSLTRETLTGIKTFPGYREWSHFRQPDPEVVASLPVYLDSAGFVAQARYRGFPWTVSDYLDLCAAAPWRWCASMDCCVEPEVAPNSDVVLDRISQTVRLNIACLNGAASRGISDRMMPVIQGWEPDQYVRCLDRLGGFLDGRTLLGVGSMCRRHVAGRTGILAVIDRLDRALPPGVGLHLFGLKSQGMEEVRGHPRVASVDSQAYGVAARRQALKFGISKSDAVVADMMSEWYETQIQRLGKPRFSFQAPHPDLALLEPARSLIDARIHPTAEAFREMLEDGEIDGINPQWICESAFQDEEDAL